MAPAKFERTIGRARRPYIVGGALFRSWETAVTSCVGANGLDNMMLLGTPLEADSAAPYFRFPSIVAQAWATAELVLSPPGVVAQPPFSTKLPCIYADTFLSSTKLLAASDEC